MLLLGTLILFILVTLLALQTAQPYPMQRTVATVDPTVSAMRITAANHPCKSMPTLVGHMGHKDGAERKLDGAQVVYAEIRPDTKIRQGNEYDGST